MRLAAAFLVWFALRVRREATTQEGEGSQLGRAALIVIGLLMLHSLVDYPLRTIAMSCVFALACALTFPAPGPTHSGNADIRLLRGAPSARTTDAQDDNARLRERIAQLDAVPVRDGRDEPAGERRRNPHAGWD